MMTFWEIAKTTQARHYFISLSQAITRTAKEVLEGFRWQGKIDLDEAAEYAKNLTHGRCIFTAMGYEVDKECLEVAIKITQGLDHPCCLNRAGRQVCCRICHTCCQPLREVLDGELWCGKCQTYR